MSEALVPVERAAAPVAYSGPVTVDQLVARRELIKEVAERVMQEGEHFGKIEGRGEKKSLFKAGAEVLLTTFGLRPVIDLEHDVRMLDQGNGHREYTITTHLYNSAGEEIATGLGSCTTMETRYRYRKGERVCPSCQKAAIVKGKEEYGGGWYCMPGKGGCGKKFRDGDQAIESQPTGRTENPDIADVYNSVLKMAGKRSLVDGTIKATACSDMFTQDADPAGQARPQQQPRQSAGPRRQVDYEKEIDAILARLDARLQQGPFAVDDAIRQEWDALGKWPSRQRAEGERAITAWVNKHQA